MTNVKRETNIDGYDVHLELYEENKEPRSDCFIGLPTTRGNWRFSASLAALEATGVLNRCSNGAGDDEHEVPQRTIERIQQWADEHGY
jgi:hypothetical protein